MNRLNSIFAGLFCLVASLAGAPQAQAQTTTVEYLHTDALGTPVAVTDAAGVVIERSEYEPYGQLVNRPLTDGPGFTGHVQDAATGLTYMQQRYYDPTIGRFLSVDPVTAYGSPGANFNRYWYANNNPHKFIDLDGREAGYAYNSDGSMHHMYMDKAPDPAAAKLALEVYVTIVPIARGYTLLRALGGIALNRLASEKPAPVRQEVHGNSRESKKEQHRYEIIDNKNGDVAKTGISGQKLLKDGASPRANSQVNALNKVEGEGAYSARVVETNIPGRGAALDAERAATTVLRGEGNTLRLQQRPKP